MNGHAYDPVQAPRQSQQAEAENVVADVNILLNQEIPNCQQTLLSSHQNLDVLATYCDERYSEHPNKKEVLEQTREYCTQSLASVAYQINNLAGNFIAVLDLQAAHMETLELSLRNLNCAVDIHREKVARREIGNITSTKLVVATQGAKIRKPATELSPIKYSRKRIDFTELDHIGHGISFRPEEQPVVQRRVSIAQQGAMDQSSMASSTLSRSSINSTSNTSSGISTMSGSGTLRGKPVSVPAAPMAPESYQPGSLAMRSLQDKKKSDLAARNIESVGLPISYEDNRSYDMQRNISRSSAASEAHNSDTSSISSSGVGSDYKYAAEAFGYGGYGAQARTSSVSSNSGGVGDYKVRGDAFRYAPPDQVVMMQQRLGRNMSQSSQGNTPNIPEDLVYVGGEFRPVLKEEPQPQDYSPYYPNQQQKPNFVRPQMQLPPHLSNTGAPSQVPPNPVSVNSASISQQLQPPPPQGILTNSKNNMQTNQYGHGSSVSSSYNVPQPQQLQQKQVKVMQQPQVTNLADISQNFANQQMHNPPAHPQFSPMTEQPGMNPRYNGAPSVPPASLDKCEKVVALYDYTAEQDDELTFVEGQIIFVWKKNDDGWYEGLMPPTYQRGLFPGNYVEAVPR